MPARDVRYGSLTSSIAPNFSSNAKHRGDNYAYGKSVTIHEWTDTAIVATVRGTEVHQVILERAADGSTALLLSCTCPYYLDTGPCKHMWAFARVVERDSRWDATWNTPTLEVDANGVGNFSRAKVGQFWRAVKPEADRAPDDDDPWDEDPLFDPEFGGSRKWRSPTPSLSEIRNALERQLTRQWERAGNTANPSMQSPQQGGPSSRQAAPPDADDQAARMAAHRLQALRYQLHDEEIRRRSRMAVTSGDASTTERVFIIHALSARLGREMSVYIAYRTRTGPEEWSIPKPVAISALDLPHITDEGDRELLGWMMGLSAQSAMYGYYGGGVPTAPFIHATQLMIPAPYQAAVVPRIIATGRCYMYEDASGGTYRLLKWDARPWTLRLDISRVAADRRLRSCPAPSSLIGDPRPRASRRNSACWTTPARIAARSTTTTSRRRISS